MQTCTADTREPHVDSRWRTLAGCALVFVVMTWAYHRSPVLQLTDSLYSFLLAENLLDHQEIELDRYFPPQHSSRGYPEVAPGAELPRQMRRIDGHIYYYFPHGTAFLCLPLVAALRTKHSAVDASGGYDPRLDQLSTWGDPRDRALVPGRRWLQRIPIQRHPLVLLRARFGVALRGG